MMSLTSQPRFFLTGTIRRNLVAFCVVLSAGLATTSPAQETTASSSPPTVGLYLHMSWSKSDSALKQIIPAARRLGYDALVLEIGGNVQLDAQAGLGAAWSKEDVRQLLELARSNNLEVIPCASLLGHPECTPRSARFVDSRIGMKLWEPGVYEFLDKYISEVCALFGRPRYFHARMDESRAVILEGSKQAGVTTAQFLADHIKRVNAIVRRNGMRLVIYHDMLLPIEAAQIGTALGGPPLNSWKAIEDIPRDVIINFWLYQFWSAHGSAVEFFTRRGFEVWLSPWLTPDPMCKWAAERNMPIIQTTWADPTCLAMYEAHLRAFVLAPIYRGDVKSPDRFKLPFDPLLKGVRALSFAEPQLAKDFKLLPLPKHDSGAGSEISIELPEHIKFAGRHWDLQPTLFHKLSETLDDRLRGAKLPLKAIRSDGVERVINGVNRYRGEADVILYTPAFGPHTSTNMFGGEATIIDNIVQERSADVWSSGGYVIPPGGCVLSGHCSKDVPKFMLGLNRYQPVRIVDANGTDLLRSPPDDGKLQDGLVVPIELRQPVQEIWLLHATLNEMSLRGSPSQTVRPLVGEVLAQTPKGPHRFDIRYRRHVASHRVARWILNEKSQPADDVWLCWSSDRGYGDVRCLWVTRLTLDEPQRVSSIRLRPTIAGAEAGWIVAAVAVVAR